MKTIDERSTTIQIDGSSRFIAISTEDEDFPRIDLYYDNGIDEFIVASLEKSEGKAVRLIAYTSLSDDEPTAVHMIDPAV